MDSLRGVFGRPLFELLCESKETSGRYPSVLIHNGTARKIDLRRIVQNKHVIFGASTRMAEVMTVSKFPALQFQIPKDNRHLAFSSVGDVHSP